MKKNYTEQQLQNAFAEGKTMSGAAKVLGCDPKTFKRYWLEIGSPDVTPTLTDPDDQQESEYSDQRVEAIVNKHRDNKAENETYAIIIEMTDRIDADSGKVDALKDEIKRFETYLKNMEL